MLAGSGTSRSGDGGSKQKYRESERHTRRKSRGDEKTISKTKTGQTLIVPASSKQRSRSKDSRRSTIRPGRADQHTSKGLRPTRRTRDDEQDMTETTTRRRKRNPDSDNNTSILRPINTPKPKVKPKPKPRTRVLVKPSLLSIKSAAPGERPQESLTNEPSKRLRQPASKHANPDATAEEEAVGTGAASKQQRPRGAEKRSSPSMSFFGRSSRRDNDGDGETSSLRSSTSTSGGGGGGEKTAEGERNKTLRRPSWSLYRRSSRYSTRSANTM